MDSATARRVRQHAKNECANYDRGCCMRDDAPCRAVSGSEECGYTMTCTWFMKAVLPLDTELLNRIKNEQ